MLKKIGVLIVLAGLMLSLSGPVLAQETPGKSTTLTVDGVDRTYTVTVPPSYDSQQAAPLLIALHPFASSGKAMEAISGLDALAADQGFIVAYPDSYDLDWDDGQTATGWPSDLQFADDVGFISALIDHLAGSYTLDPKRIYLAGFAAGGDLAYRLACALPDRFAKVAVVNALLWDYHVTQCTTSASPLSMLILHGAENLDRPAAGRTFQSDDGLVTLHALGTQATAAFWAERDGCDLKTVQTSQDPASIVYTPCPGGTSVSLYTFKGVGNNWPRVGAYTLNQSGIDATGILTQFFTHDGPPTVPGDGTTAIYDGMARSYIVYVPPSYDPAAPLPLVMVLHGRTGTGASTAYVYDMDRVASREGFIVVYPDGTHVEGTEAGREWNYLYGIPGYGKIGLDDVNFLSILVDDLARDLNIDQDRLYVTGYSNGGFMAQRLACSAPQRWAAFSSISGTLDAGLINICKGQPPVPMLMIHGTLDQIVPWNGLIYGGQIALYSAPDTAVFWAAHDECDPNQIEHTVLPSPQAKPETQVHRYIFTSCAGGSEVDYYAIDGGGHTVPGTANRQIWQGAGAVNTDIRASEVLWDFFKRYSLSHQE